MVHKILLIYLKNVNARIIKDSSSLIVIIIVIVVTICITTTAASRTRCDTNYWSSRNNHTIIEDAITVMRLFYSTPTTRGTSRSRPIEVVYDYATSPPFAKFLVDPVKKLTHFEQSYASVGYNYFITFINAKNSYYCQY